MSISMTEASETLEQHFDELHERYPESKVELANMFTLSEALLILCLCCNSLSTPSMFDQSTLTDIYTDSIENIDSHDVHLALRKLKRKLKQLNAFQTYAVLAMASECLSVPENSIIEPKLLLELRVKYVFGIAESTLA